MTLFRPNEFFVPRNNNTASFFLLIYPCAYSLSWILELGIHEVNESRSTCFEFSSSLLRMCLTCLHTCWWFILEVARVLFSHILMLWVTRDKLHTLYSQINHYMIWIGGRNDVNKFAQSICLICSLKEVAQNSHLICSDWFSLACCMVIISLITRIRINVLSFNKWE